MDEHLFQGVRRGEVSFAAFAARTDKIWHSFAIKMIGRFEVPAHLGVEDLVQEMLLGCYRSIRDFDPERGKSIRVHATWNAINAARKLLHRARRAGHEGGRAPSRHEVATELIEEMAVAEAEQERAVWRESSLNAALEKAGPYRAIVEHFVRTSSLDETTAAVIGSQAWREALGVARFAEARREVRRLIELAASVDAQALA